KIAELGPQFFPLKAEETEGLFKSRIQTVDQLTLFCNSQEVVAQCISSLHFFEETIKIFSFEPEWVLFDQRAAGAPVSQSVWHCASSQLKEAVKGIQGHVEREVANPGWDGPRLEMRLSDSLGRKWPISHLGISCSLKKERVTLTGSLFGALER